MLNWSSDGPTPKGRTIREYAQIFLTLDAIQDRIQTLCSDFKERWESRQGPCPRQEELISPIGGT